MFTDIRTNSKFLTRKAGAFTFVFTQDIVSNTAYLVKPKIPPSFNNGV